MEFTVLYISMGHVIKQLIHAFSCAVLSYSTLGKFVD